MLIDQEQVDMKTLVEQFQAISDPFPGCLPVLETGMSESGQPYIDKQLRELQGYFDEKMALGGGLSEESYVAIAQESLGQMNLADPGIRPLFANGIHLMLTTFPAEPAMQTQTALRVTEKNVLITFPQVIRLDQVKGVEDLGLKDQLERLTIFYRMMDEVYGQGQANRIEDGQPLVQLLDGHFDVQLNVDGSPLYGADYWQLIEDARTTPERARAPYDAFLRSLWTLYYQESYAYFTGGDATKERISPAEVVRELVDNKGIPVEEILAMLENTFGVGEQPYQLDSWNLGYVPRRDLLLPWRVPLTLRVGYEFRFVPNQKAGYDAYARPPVNISVGGQFGEKCSQ